MPPKKETVSKDEFNALKREIERHSQILVDQLRQQIADNEEKCLQQISDNKEKYMQKIRELEDELN